ncbi:hypothetical protein [Streptomyces sp. NPDC048623]|uniref:hypothetical protein n=1 Tax=Streptomyces sp. NPDC048623 TaxID=3155761 RepID=UPI0034477936
MTPGSGERANEYDAICAHCGAPVPAGTGLLRHTPHGWQTYHPPHAPPPGPPPPTDHPGWHHRRLLSLDIATTGHRFAIDRIVSAALRSSDGEERDWAITPGREAGDGGVAGRGGGASAGPGRAPDAGPLSGSGRAPDSGRGPHGDPGRKIEPGLSASSGLTPGPGSGREPGVAPTPGAAPTPTPQPPPLPPAQVLDEVAGLVAEHLASGEILVVWFAPYVLTTLHAELLRHGLAPLSVRVPAGVGPICDPLVLDRHADRYRPGSRSLHAVADWYGIPHLHPGEPGSDAGAALALARAIPASYPTLARLSRPALHTEQIIWYAEQTERHPDAPAWPFEEIEPLPWEENGS